MTAPSLTAPLASLPWQTETRPAILAADGFAAETTFVWDPISDRLLSVYRTGASVIAGDPNGNLLKQVIHGDLSYDDPIEVTTIDITATPAPNGSQPMTRLYPIYDEAGGGTLQAVVNRNGELVVRSVNNDPFGGEQFDLPGAAIDKMSVKATKDASGNLTNVVVTMRSTGQLAASTLATGTRLAVVDSNYIVLRTATATPALATNDAYTVQWTLSATEWNTLTNPNPVTIGGTTHTPAALSVAATTNLRAAMWAAEVPILPAPSWTTTTSVRTTADLPVEILDSLASLSDLITTTPPASEKTRTPYDVPNLGMLGKQTGDANIEMTMAATFQAQPFAEPFSRKFYVRARWYDPETGTWLTPDPKGYADSSNLYAFAGGDPVNGRDPTAELTRHPTAHKSYDIHGGSFLVVNIVIDGLKRIKGLTGEGGEALGVAEQQTETPPYHYSYTKVAGRYTFKITSLGEVEYCPVIILPNWAEYDRAPQSDQDSWDLMESSVATHEEGHVRIGELTARWLELRLVEELSHVQFNVTAKDDSTARQQAIERIRILIKNIVEEVNSKREEMQARYHDVVGRTMDNACLEGWTAEVEAKVFREVVGVSPKEIEAKDAEVEFKLRSHSSTPSPSKPKSRGKKSR